jgi:hypothetical protein
VKTAKEAERIVDTIDGLTERPFPVGYVAPAYTPNNAITSKGYGADKEAVGPNPNVLIFARQMSEPLATLARKVDEIARDPDSKLDNFVVLVGKDDKLEAALKELAEKHKLKNTTLSVETSSRVRSFRVSKQNDITVLVCDNGASRGFYTFKMDEFTPQRCDKFLAELNRILQASKTRR